MYKPEFTSWPDTIKKPTVTVVTPVYNEDPDLFEEAMQSWISNGVDEIIAVIDKSNTRHVVNFDRHYVGRKDIKCRMIVTPKPGKRAALCDGITQATTDLIALVDSDTVWGEGVLEKSIPLFLNSSVGGVTVGQRIQNPDNVSNVMFDLLLWTRYREEVPFLLGVGKVFNTLSGRTAFYRKEALINPKHDNVHDLRHEHFFGTRGVSGDDKRLTHLILEQGWLIQFALGAEVYTPGLSSIRKFLKQRLRWTRNSWRADTRAIKRGWVLKHPALSLFMIDRFFQPIFILIGPVVFILAIRAEDWVAAGILLAWWFFSRLVRLFGYFRRYPKRLIYLPAYIVYGYLNALIKIYALATLLEHSWATRWHKARMKKRQFKKFIPIISGGTAVILFCIGILMYVNNVSTASGANIKVPQDVVESEFSGNIDFSATMSPTNPALPTTSVLPTGVQSYVVKPGDSLQELATQFGMTVPEIKRLNGLRDPDVVNVGQTLLHYPTPTEGAEQ